MPIESDVFEQRLAQKSRSTVPVLIDFPVVLLRQLDAKCRSLGERRNPTIRQAVREFLQRAAENGVSG